MARCGAPPIADRLLLRQHRIGHEGDEDQERDEDDERVTGDPVKTARRRLGQILMRMADHGTPRLQRETDSMRAFNTNSRAAAMIWIKCDNKAPQPVGRISPRVRAPRGPRVNSA